MQLTSPWITWKYNMGRGFVVISFEICQITMLNIRIKLLCSSITSKHSLL